MDVGRLFRLFEEVQDRGEELHRGAKERGGFRDVLLAEDALNLEEIVVIFEVDDQHSYTGNGLESLPAADIVAEPARDAGPERFAFLVYFTKRGYFQILCTNWWKWV